MEIEMKYVIIGNYGSHEKVLALASTEEDAKRGVTYYRAIGYKDVTYVKKEVRTFEPLSFIYKGRYSLKVSPTENENIYELEYIIGAKPDKEYFIEGKLEPLSPYKNVELIKHYNCTTHLDSYYVDINFSVNEFPEDGNEMEIANFLIEMVNEQAGGKFTVIPMSKEE